MRVAMHVFVPCLIFTAILDARFAARDVTTLALATGLQIACGLAVGWIALRAFRLQAKRELLLPIAFVNSANLPFPLVVANFGPDALSPAVVCYMVTSVSIFSLGTAILHGRGDLRGALREPTLWAAALAITLKSLGVELDDMLMRAPRLAATAAIPLILVLFGDALSRTSMTAAREATVVTVARYASGALALGLTLLLLHPEGAVRKVLIFYALLPAAVVNVTLTQKAGRDAGLVAAAVLMTTLVGVVLIPVLLAFLH